jgi:hypothetical protein
MMPLWPMAAMPAGGSRTGIYSKRHWKEGISGSAVCAEERNLPTFSFFSRLGLIHIFGRLIVVATSTSPAPYHRVVYTFLLFTFNISSLIY